MGDPNEGLFSSPADNLPDGGTPQKIKRGPGRPRKNPTLLPPQDSWLEEEKPHVIEESEGPEVFDLPTEEDEPVKEKPMSATTLAVVSAVSILLAHECWANYGFIERSLFEVGLDASPSERNFQHEARAAGDELTVKFQSDAAARNRADVMILLLAEWCKPVAFAHGKFELPQYKEGRGTFGMPWLDGLAVSAETWGERLADRGIGKMQGLTLVISDFRFKDWFEVKDALREWKAKMKELGQVVVACAYGNTDFTAAAAFSDLPVVSLKEIPLAALFEVLAASMSSSLARPGSLARLVRANLAALTAKGS